MHHSHKHHIETNVVVVTYSSEWFNFLQTSDRLLLSVQSKEESEGRYGISFPVRWGFVQARKRKTLLLIIDDISSGIAARSIQVWWPGLDMKFCQWIRLQNAVKTENQFKNYKPTQNLSLYIVYSHKCSLMLRQKKPEMDRMFSLAWMEAIEAVGYWLLLLRCLFLRSNYTFTWILWDLSAYLQIIKLKNLTTVGSFVSKSQFTSVFRPWEACTNRTNTPTKSQPYKAAIQASLHNTAPPRIS